MRTSARDVLPAQVRRSLVKFGGDVSRARRRRRLTAAMMAERLGISLNTYARIERGDVSVGMGAYAMALFVLGFGTPFAELADQRRDDQGLLLEAESLPKRVRPRKDVQAT